MAERKFTRGLGRPGLAAQLRENVSQAVKATTTQSRPRLAAPIDFEDYTSKNKIFLNNDSLRELVIYPVDDLSYTTTPVETRTLHCIAAKLLEREVSNPLVRQSLETYSQFLNTLTFKYLPYSGSYLHLPRLPRIDDLKEQVYEIDTDIEQRDLAILSNGENILKKGYLLKGPEGGNEKIFGNFSAKTFKRRFACLRQEVDGTYLLEFHKDERKQDSKGAIDMDFCTQVSKNPKRGKCCFELTLSENARTILLSAESEADLEDWMDKLTRVLHADKPEDEMKIDRSFTPPSSNYGTLRGLEHSLNPQLIKYAHESDFSIGQLRKEERHQLFTCYPNLSRSECEQGNIEIRDESQIRPYEHRFGIRVRVTCESIKFKLQVPLDSTDGPLTQIEPYMMSLCVFDVQNGCKLSEDFHFDLNNTMARNLLARKKKEEVGSEGSFPLQLAGVPEEWLAYPKQAVISVQKPHNEVYLVVRIEKVLQGSISQAAENYIKPPEPKNIPKLQKNIKTCCQRLGDFRMPFAWCARPLFKLSGQVDEHTQFSPLYKCEEKRLSDNEMLKILCDLRKPEKMNKFTLIPGTVCISVGNNQHTLPNTVTPSMEPVKPFPNPPTHEPTIELQEFSATQMDSMQPYTSFSNHLYIYPKFLNYENQKTFSRARNLVCFVEIRDSDTDQSSPLPLLYSRPGHSKIMTSQLCCAVIHHSTFPEWYDEIKISLPINITPQHHLLFTFAHVSVEAAKAGKKEDPIETVGYAWLPLLNRGRILGETHTVPVAAHLPAKYLTIEPLGLGKGFSGPDIRWVDSQKNVFKVSVKLSSTVFTSDQHLHNFFMCSGMIAPATSRLLHSPEQDVVKNLKALLALELRTIVEFLPTILNQLFVVLLSGSFEVSTNVTRVLVHIINEICEAGREELLRSYIKYVQCVSCEGKKSVHEELCKALPYFLQSSPLEPVTSNKILRHLEFFFDFIIRSMAMHLLTTNRIKMARNERFNEDLHTAVKALVELVCVSIIEKYKENPFETRRANIALAHFIKRCLSMLDRGFVFGLMKLYLEYFNAGDPVVLQVYKFNFLRIVSSHEHFVPLNLPVFNIAQNGDSKKCKMRHGIEEFHLSNDFISHHFIVGALLSEVKSALGEVIEVQRTAILVLRDLLAKHSFDDRYVAANRQGRIACLYFPIVSILMENVYRLSWPAKPKVDTLSMKKGSDCRSSTRTRLSTKTYGSVDSYSNSIRSSLRSDPSIKYDSSYLSIIAGPGGHGATVLNSHRSITSLESDDATMSVANSDVQEEDDDFDETASMVKTHSRNLSLAFTGESGPVRYDKLCPSEVRDLLVCLLYVLKNVPQSHLVAWWTTLSKECLSNFFTLLTLSLHHFKYQGKRHIVRDHVPIRKASTLPTKLQPPYYNNRMSVATDTYSVSSHEGEGWTRALQEANLATEVGLIVLDALCAFTIHFRDTLQADVSGELVHQVFSLHLIFLQLGQSETLMKHVFAALRAFINNFPAILFQGDASLCGSLCFEMLKYCNSKLTNLRHEACAVLYLLMRSNYEYTRRSGINRVHLQVIISVSELLGEVIGLNNSRFQESMALINSYASSDKAMTATGFVSEVRDLTKRIRTVLVATAQMKEHETDPEMLCDLQFSLAASYAATPELRSTWLQAMAKHHMKNGDFSEAAFCQLHTAALMAEYLKHRGQFNEGCAIFSIISPNIAKDESNLRLDADVACENGSVRSYRGQVDTVFTMDSLIKQLELCAAMVEKAERYELLGNLYRILIPIYEQRSNYSALVNCYSHLYQAYSRVVEVNASQKRLLGRYYRVAFYGPNYFEDESGKEYIYKEPKVTSLAEISERLNQQYSEKFGKEAIKMIMDSNPVDSDELETRYAYIQVTHVDTYWSDGEERSKCTTEFERNHNIKKFMFETPFTKEGKAHGKLEDQWKRRTLLTTAYTFPYVKKRIIVVDTQVQEMSPIEVAIDEMCCRVKELSDAVQANPCDIIKLQLKLQGSISVQVNAGPLAYANTFLQESNARSYPHDQVTKLKDVYRQFMMTAKQALDLNGSLISNDQYEYQMALETNFSELLSSLSNILCEPLLAAQVQVDSMLKKSPLHYLSMISSPGGSSMA